MHRSPCFTGMDEARIRQWMTGEWEWQREAGGEGEIEGGRERERLGATWRLSSAESLNQSRRRASVVSALDVLYSLFADFWLTRYFFLFPQARLLQSPTPTKGDHTEAHGASLLFSWFWTAESPSVLAPTASIQTGGGETASDRESERATSRGLIFFTLHLFLSDFIYFLVFENCPNPPPPSHSHPPRSMWEPWVHTKGGGGLCIEAPRIPQANLGSPGPEKNSLPGPREPDMPRRKQQAPRRAAGKLWLRFTHSWPLFLSSPSLYFASPLSPYPIHVL